MRPDADRVDPGGRADHVYDHRRPDGQRRVPGLRPEGPPSVAPAGRHRRAGQPALAQDGGSGRGHPERGRRGAVSSRLFAGPESDREDVEQNQGDTPGDRGADVPRAAPGDPKGAAPGHAPGRGILVRLVRLHFFLNSSR